MKYEKIKNQLKVLEKEFRDDLLPRLRRTAEGKETVLFCTSELNQFPQVRPPAESDQLFETAKEIIELRHDLLMPVDEGTQLAAAYLAACIEYNDIKTPHRRGPLRLAEYLLVVAKKEDA